ncbi:hypothetical protein GO684_02615 [Wolbachia endosymbiont of Litomosoides brasiliensis]|uniref:hypothetical protein n=1 Tax=Wolbachia endosymbiont of Litomosoides brasiliensis TaxID=1812117 RepID=UPI001589BFEB|nr:hypothetical protein [Wolbachia endosymbiont of Litomosoides brasiliensis]NUY39564.1 hypothetical protein [Wolbachia endosymbiont of Litomosoides brasiliensis]
MGLGGLFTGSILAGSLLAIGSALLFPILVKVGIGVVIKLAEAVKKYISNTNFHYTRNG